MFSLEKNTHHMSVLCEKREDIFHDEGRCTNVNCGN